MPKVRHRTHRQIHQTETSIKKVELCWWLSQRLNRKTAHVYLYYLLFVYYIKKDRAILYDIAHSIGTSLHRFPASMGISTGWLVFFNPWASLTPGAAETACGGRWWRRKADGLLLQEVSSSPLSEAPSSRERWWWWWWWSLDHLIIWWSCSWNTWCSSTKGSTITSIYSTKRGHRRFVLGVLVVLSGANCWYQLKNCQRSPWHWRFQGGGGDPQSHWSFHGHFLM